MRRPSTVKAQAIWGAIAGVCLTAIILVGAGAISAGTIPLMLADVLDPFCFGHSIFAVLLLGLVAGAVLGGLSVKWRTSK